MVYAANLSNNLGCGCELMREHIPRTDIVYGFGKDRVYARVFINVNQSVHALQHGQTHVANGDSWSDRSKHDVTVECHRRSGKRFNGLVLGKGFMSLEEDAETVPPTADRDIDDDVVYVALLSSKPELICRIEITAIWTSSISLIRENDPFSSIFKARIQERAYAFAI
ncbi:uncharacterized protein SCHCODRAFT_02512948 [Schizophyllum commune H4-8]|uniref:Uncharacterized protein n=1 Tax=Schizophyllum commune (strain H4-8 / FGSC 9210) TaxID=578458 RepID=D8QEX3_SCHCM|nr:uncharacterized protein SCHCODRAFT_02512948 [Schizophyllum commune H4-8]KAI5888886.1 hypothetical protein SCHCODRAFT_02512948 [Schizophyllum commune H4-8]